LEESGKQVINMYINIYYYYYSIVLLVLLLLLYCFYNNYNNYNNVNYNSNINSEIENMYMEVNGVDLESGIPPKKTNRKFLVYLDKVCKMLYLSALLDYFRKFWSKLRFLVSAARDFLTAGIGFYQAVRNLWTTINEVRTSNGITNVCDALFALIQLWDTGRKIVDWIQQHQDIVLHIYNYIQQHQNNRRPIYIYIRILIYDMYNYLYS